MFEASELNAVLLEAPSLHDGTLQNNFFSAWLWSNDRIRPDGEAIVLLANVLPVKVSGPGSTASIAAAPGGLPNPCSAHLLSWSHGSDNTYF